MLTAGQWAFIAFHTEQDQLEDLEVRKALTKYDLALHYVLEKADRETFVSALNELPVKQYEPADDLDKELQAMVGDPYFGVIGGPTELPPLFQNTGPLAQFGDLEPPFMGPESGTTDGEPRFTFPPFPIGAPGPGE